MIELIQADFDLIDEARKVITKNYDTVLYNHTVGAAIRCKSGNIYVGVNIYSSLGACAEFIAIGAAITAGEREFECIVAVRGENGEEIVPPCGNCRQMLMHYTPNCDVVIDLNDMLRKVKVFELLPFAYKTND